ncbi:E3 ubiquitin-protein ligase RNF217 isoform X2 [Spea bombifrons]|uniref:E3 ubiquitin-protein ligase RNF217 isoform X2 n=1 Tax=Spea bombifrons TaxID=233779 RepID=UPI002349F0C1|nr:E3 ubiquitin-protein ligase RNF217 isoform X2 [Spea bombifrons]
MGRRTLRMGDQHEELHQRGTRDAHTASSDEGGEEEEEDGGKADEVFADPLILQNVRVLGSPGDPQAEVNSDDQDFVAIGSTGDVDRGDALELQEVTSQETDIMEYEPTSERFARTKGITGSSGAPKTKRRCSVLCTVYCVESELSGEPPPVYSADQSNLPDVPTRSSERVSYELPLSPTSLDLDLSPYLISSLADPGNKVLMNCRVCLEDRSIKPLVCCKKPVCEECLKRYLSSQVHIGQVEIKCPITECNKHLDESTIVYNLPRDEILKYKYFLELSRMDSSTKPCPQCKHFTTFKRKAHVPNLSKSEIKFKIQCPSCQFIWCFKCHSPWHEGVNCREYKKGDKLLRHWAGEIEHGQRNAQKCPKCKVHIQRTEGCDHMTCSQCNTNFCYRCGERYRQLRFFGDHTSNLSIFGCKYRYLPERPHVRRLVRGSVCAGKLLIAPLLIVLGLVLGAIAVVIGIFVLPVYVLCKKRRKRTRSNGMSW